MNDCQPDRFPAPMNDPRDFSLSPVSSRVCVQFVDSRIEGDWSRGRYTYVRTYLRRNAGFFFSLIGLNRKAILLTISLSFLCGSLM